MTVRLEGATPADDQDVVSSNFFEPNSTTLNAGDFAVVELSAPMTVNGATDNFFNPIFQGADANLNGQTLACAGYGNNALATPSPGPGLPGTPGGGGGVLRSGNLAVNLVGTNTLRLAPNGLGQIGAPGDSGSTCFFNNQVVGVQSTCTGPWTDLNGDGQFQNFEWTGINSCTVASPGAHRAFAEARVLADVEVGFTVVPQLAQPVTATIETARDSDDVDIRAAVSLAAFAPRSGWIEARVDNEPPNTLCTVVRERAPLNGDAELRGLCMNEGLLVTLL